MVSGTRETVGIRSNKMRSLPKAAWVVVDGTHEAIISPEIYQQASDALKSRIRTVNDNTAGNRSQNLFVCGYCGRRLQRSHGKEVHLFCMRARFDDSPGCESLHENVETLRANTLRVVKLHAKLLLSKTDYIKKLDSAKREQIKNQIRIAEMKLRKEREAWNKQYDAACNTAQSVRDILALSEYRPEVIARLVNQVRIFGNGRLEIELRNVDAFKNYLLPERIAPL